jgi:predicted nucleic acid-binding protein
MIALDTNVLLYACDRADSRRQQIAIDLIANSRDGVLLWQVACEFVAASRKLSAQGFTASDAWNRLTEFLTLLPLILPTVGVLERGQRLHATHGVSFWVVPEICVALVEEKVLITLTALRTGRFVRCLRWFRLP